MPRLPLAHDGTRLQARGVNTGPFGETIANDHRPGSPRSRLPTKPANVLGVDDKKRARYMYPLLSVEGVTLGT
ncbi:MAG TPA: hypothetical protein VKA73_14540 [Rubrobacter sp.]|nr:hypothetical protein [Rubrobacter sp.]